MSANLTARLRSFGYLLSMALRKTLTTLVFPRRRAPTASHELGERYFSDFYHHLLTSSWPSLILQIASAFLVLNILFGLGYLLDGGIDNARPGSFADVFFSASRPWLPSATAGSRRLLSPPTS